MPKLTENRLRTIIKEEIKVVLMEGDVVDLQQYKKQSAIRNRGSLQYHNYIQNLIYDLAVAYEKAVFLNDEEAKERIKAQANEHNIFGAVEKKSEELGERRKRTQINQDPNDYLFQR